MPTTPRDTGPDPMKDPERQRRWNERQERWMRGDDLDEETPGAAGLPPPPCDEACS